MKNIFSNTPSTQKLVPIMERFVIENYKDQLDYLTERKPNENVIEILIMLQRVLELDFHEFIHQSFREAFGGVCEKIKKDMD